MGSGPVPRTIAPGIVWGEEAEADFSELVMEMAARMSRADAEREARWVVELQLCRRFYMTQVGRALRCTTADAKRALYAEWQRLYGNERASRLARYVKNERTSRTVMTW